MPTLNAAEWRNISEAWIMYLPANNDYVSSQPSTNKLFILSIRRVVQNNAPPAFRPVSQFVTNYGIFDEHYLENVGSVMIIPDIKFDLRVRQLQMTWIKI